jgi:hypothetical protein
MAPQQIAHSIYGHIYEQQSTIGLASYHFVSPENAYISYAAAPKSWRLADGSPPPAQKHTVSPSYDRDVASRTFHGTIFWGTNHLAGNSAYWMYEMRFSSDLRTIDSGVVRSFALDGTEDRDPIRFGIDLVYEQVAEELALFPVHGEPAPAAAHAGGGFAP